MPVALNNFRNGDISGMFPLPITTLAAMLPVSVLILEGIPAVILAVILAVIPVVILAVIPVVIPAVILAVIPLPII